MPHVHQASALFSFGDRCPTSPGWETVSVEDFNARRASGWSPTEYAPRRQETLIVRRRMTPSEKQALHAARQSSWQVDDFIGQADAAGVIDEDDPNFSDAVAALDALGIIAAGRWSELLAP